MTKGYILECIVWAGVIEGDHYLYIPKSEGLGPAGLGLGDQINPIPIWGEDLESELAVKTGKSEAYERLKEVEVPKEIEDLILSYREYKKSDEAAKPVLKKILF